MDRGPIQRRARVGAVVAASLLLVAACTGGDTGARVGTDGSRPADSSRSSTTTEGPAKPDPEAEAGPWETERIELEVVDPSRPTVDAEGKEIAPDRTMVTDVWMPEDGGPFPLIVFSHGLNGHPDKFESLLGAWAEAGYVVAAPAFPATNDRGGRGPLNPGEVGQQPADVSAVIDELLRLNQRDGSPVEGRIDPDRIGTGGLSLGGATTYAVVYGRVNGDDRIDAAVVLAGVLLPPLDTYDLTDGPPILVAHGTADILPPDGARRTWDELPPPKYFLSLLGADHAPPYEDDPTPYDDLVEATTTSFWNAYLRTPGQPDQDAIDAMVEAAEVPELAVLSTG